MRFRVSYVHALRSFGGQISKLSRAAEIVNDTAEENRILRDMFQQELATELSQRKAGIAMPEIIDEARNRKSSSY